MNSTHWEVPSKDLCNRFDPQQFSFKTTEELPQEEEVIGQERAVRAMDFGLHIHDRGYNIYVSGVPGTGKNTIIKSMIRRVAETQPSPDDWCYVHNFQDPDHPKALNLPAGKGREFQRDMDRLIASLRDEFPKVFQSKEYEDQLRLLEEGLSKARDSLTRDLEERAKEYGFEINSSRLGIFVVPIIKGKPLQAEQLEALDPALKAEIQRKEKILHEHIHNFVQQVRALRMKMDQKIEQINRRIAHYTSEHSFESLREKYQTFPKVMEYIQAIQQDVLENFKDFLPASESPIQIAGIEIEPPRKSMTRYAVNVVVDNGGVKGAPLVEEVNPTYNNLFGRIEKKSRFGTLYTDFTLIKAGSLLQSNGGYLLVNILDVLRSPFSWEALKRVIKNQEVKIEGFYAVCKALGLTGEQGVIIPCQNIKHLMLKQEVVNSVSSGQFHVYAVSTVDEALEVLTGCPAGELRSDGTYPEGTVNAVVQKRLREMGEKMRAMENKNHHAIPSPASDASNEGLEQ